jgi:hypothetical protein
LPFNLARIREWSFYRLGSAAETPWRDFMASLEERPQLLEVAGNPLLLSLAVSLYRRSSALPQSSSVLLKSYFDAVTEQWDSVRGVVRQRDPWAGPAYKLAVLCRTAYHLRSQGRELFTTAEFADWNRDFGVDETLLHVCARHTGVVTEHRSQDLWSFTHRIFSDFLSARYIVDHSNDASQHLQPFFKSGNWLDVWAFCCGISQDATSLIYVILRNRRISKQEKIQALAAAFEQDIIVSSGAGRAAALFFKVEINRLKGLPSRITRRGPQKWSLRFESPASSSDQLLALFISLNKLRKSKMGNDILGWLGKSNIKVLSQLAEIFNEKDVVSIRKATGNVKQGVDIELNHELSKISNET